MVIISARSKIVHVDTLRKQLSVPFDTTAAASAVYYIINYYHPISLIFPFCYCAYMAEKIGIALMLSISPERPV